MKQPSKTATYVAVVVHIESERWRGVPILLHCGKALDETKSELLVQFKPAKGSALFPRPACQRAVHSPRSQGQHRAARQPQEPGPVGRRTAC